MLVQASPEFVTHIMRDPRVWRWVAEDGVSPGDVRYQPTATYFQFQDKGFVMFRRVTQRMREIHVATRRGDATLVSFIHECLDEMRHRGAAKFIAPIGDWNVAALRLARRCGFVEEGRITGAYVRDGEPRALIMMGGC
ncbi:hypothetical protein GCM10023144_01220 [Pigmentiphaga soli]|uniref:N-acetyltransferase domain-containing protein n=2 Tax=Pigmentiphaga soli TaxID=1007095 RepID=A0ABP8GD42_9BURK